MKKILFGVCGIAGGHAYRQIPLIEHYAKNAKIMVFAYGDSLRILSKRFGSYDNIKVVPVAVPYYVGNANGLDFAETQRRVEASGIDYDGINSRALNTASKYLDGADIVISDYEPIAAQYAYAHNVPLVTIDQQSKYLYGDFPDLLNGTKYVDEVERLRLFFPRADARIACSFFDVEQRGSERVHIAPPIFRAELSEIKKSANRDDKTILVYLSAQSDEREYIDDMLKLFVAFGDYVFHVFVPEKIGVMPANVKLYKHGDEHFEQILPTCSAIISTAGHGLLSEAMYLGLPVLAMPLDIYEQQMNAEIIGKHGFGMSAKKLTANNLDEFLANIPIYRRAIIEDRKVLMRGDGLRRVINIVANYL